MKIIDIKTKVTELLNSTTIDEFYQDSNLDQIKKKVFSLTKSENKQEFEEFLLKQITENSSSKDESFFQDEFPMIRFLFNTILSKKLNINAFKREEGSSNANRPRRMDSYRAPTQKTMSLFRSENIELIKPYLIKENIIPKKWRDILFETLSNQIECFDGLFLTIDEKILKKENQELTDIDISALLAVRIASKSNYSLEIGDNKIALALSGGIIAIVSFRRKGNNIKLSDKGFEIYPYSKSIDDETRDTRFVNQTLYHQSGYTDSAIQIELPRGYYMISQKYVIDIKFKPAPILFDNKILTNGVTDVSSKALKEDEEKEREEEEERRRRDLWDDE